MFESDITMYIVHTNLIMISPIAAKDLVLSCIHVLIGLVFVQLDCNGQPKDDCKSFILV